MGMAPGAVEAAANVTPQFLPKAGMLLESGKAAVEGLAEGAAKNRGAVASTAGKLAAEEAQAASQAGKLKAAEV